MENKPIYAIEVRVNDNHPYIEPVLYETKEEASNRIKELNTSCREAPRSKILYSHLTDEMSEVTYMELYASVSDIMNSRTTVLAHVKNFEIEFSNDIRRTGNEN